MLSHFGVSKKTMDEIWALLSLRKDGLTALEMRNLLGLSKGAVSMLIQELENWKIIIRIDDEITETRQDFKRRGRVYRACTDFFQMISHVIKNREQDLVNDTIVSLNEALGEAQESASEHQIIALNTMLYSAHLVQKILLMFCNNPSFVAEIFDQQSAQKCTRETSF